ncbi:MAG TPA: DUF1284 domain-containing protein [Devosia sp.]|jgi:hypothetical protein|uniref:DUF1284 domain-containing protein n=1 Tax=Devosia sp. TaxID=1871048 RepID=UPI002DDD5D53|nr:DUF1284 domain-containing protein [Devosia sp.]HEV2518313.1 DUF1284 domain-containing protein [Devosia sp.]
MTIRLRPHHLLCLLTYVGKGYNAAFTANYDAIAARIGAGEDLLIVAGPDDICAPLLADADPHCHRDSVIERDRLALRDLGELLETPPQLGRSVVLEPAVLKQMREAFTTGRTRAACIGCEWHGLCTGIAARSYAGVVISSK